MFFMSNTNGIEGTFSALPALSLARGNDIRQRRAETAMTTASRPSGSSLESPARRGRRLPRLSSLERRDADRVRRRPATRANDAGRRTARRQGRSRRQAVRGTGGANARPRAGRSRHRPQEGLRHQRGETFQIRAARKNPPAPEAEHAGDQGVPAMVRARTQRRSNPIWWWRWAPPPRKACSEKSRRSTRAAAA